MRAVIAVLAVVASAILPPGPVAGPARVTAPQQRLQPAVFITCDRNHLTSFTGRVVSLARRADTTTLAMETDEHTTERFTLRHAGNDATAWFFLTGRPFTKADWETVMPAGRLASGVRATVWVCEDEPNPKVDWVPPAPRE